MAARAARLGRRGSDVTGSVGEGAVAVVVAYNRLGLLRESLDALFAQVVPPRAVVVIDNGSTDGTVQAVAEEYPQVDLVALGHNTGGAGGFAAGMAYASEAYSPEWLWVMDDDTVPTSTALKALLEVVGKYPVPVTLAGSRAVWTDGSDHPMNTPRQRPMVGSAELAAARAHNALPVRSTSFVSMLVSVEALRSKGLPIADYFIWNDDFEFSTRLLRDGVGIFVTDSVVVHKTARLVSTDDDPGPRFFYEVRNKLWLFFRSNGLAPLEKLLYGASTLRRWARTIVRSNDRILLVRALGRGIAAGIRRGPRPNAVVFAPTPVGEQIMERWKRSL